MLAIALDALSWILPFLFVLTLVVTVHEFGHFLAAKSCGAAVERFSIGFGRALLSWRDRSGVEWRLGWIPLGGYVKFAGDDNVASVPDSDDLDDLRRHIVAREGPSAVRRYYQFKPVWQRAIIAAAGPLANFVLSTLLFAGFLMLVGQTILPARVNSVLPGSPAMAAGLKAGDMIVSVAGKPIGSFGDIVPIVSLRAGTPVRFEVTRGNAPLQFVVTPRPVQVSDGMGGQTRMGQVGIEAPPMSERLVRRFNPITALAGGAAQTWDVLDTNVYAMARMISGRLPTSQLSGTLGMLQISHAVAQAGAQGAKNLHDQFIGSSVNLLGLVAVVSVMIGFVNLLPIPVLDGGHLLFYAYEAVARRPVAAAVQSAALRVGLALVVGLLLFTTANDLHRMGLFKFLGGPFS